MADKLNDLSRTLQKWGKCIQDDIDQPDVVTTTTYLCTVLTSLDYRNIFKFETS